jgi:adenylyltransferase/sulfurtransferase
MPGTPTISRFSPISKQEGAKAIMGRDLGGIIDLEPEEAAALLKSLGREIQLLDVRTNHENARLRIPGSILLPIQEFQERLEEIESTKETLVYCEHGYRSLHVAAFLAQNGWPKVYNLRGGIVKWKGPVEGLDAE